MSKRSLIYLNQAQQFHYFNNREMSWLDFNDRVLALTRDPEVPLLERLRFCNIFVSNNDEFIMKRVGGLKDQLSSAQDFLSIDGQSPQDQLLKISLKNRIQADELKESFIEIRKELEKEKIFLLEWKDLSSTDHIFISRLFEKRIYPLLTPLAVDSAHPFPFISNLSKSIGLVLRREKNAERLFARIKVPPSLPEWFSLPSQEGEYRFIQLEEIIINHIQNIYPKMILESSTIFRLARNAAINSTEDTDDLLELIEEELKERKFSPIVRLEYLTPTDPWILQFLTDELNLDKDDLVKMPSIANYSNFHQIIDIPRTDLKYPQWAPLHPISLREESPFRAIQKKDLLIHHPYESFSGSVEKLLEAASNDPQVRVIKITLYRTGTASKVIQSLIRAVENGKQVVCVVELKARFDEERNIHWAETLESAGVHVIYGMLNLKIHSKIMLVIRENAQLELETYCHIGTGNYHSQTAKLYTDLSFFTSQEEITSEVQEVFNYLTGYSQKHNFNNILVAPFNMRERFLEMIQQETELAKQGKHARIIAKMNSLEDKTIIQSLYQASNAGVQIDLIVRGFCCLKAKQKEFSKNIRVHSLLGRFLEHTRIYYFSQGESSPEKGLFYLGSADWMYRNLSNRVEVITPIKEQDLRLKLWDILQTSLRDNQLRWELQADETYEKVVPAKRTKNVNTHQEQMKLSLSTHKSARY